MHQRMGKKWIILDSVSSHCTGRVSRHRQYAGILLEKEQCQIPYISLGFSAGS